MASLLKLKRSSEAGRVPLPQDLDYGELALNYADGKLYYKNTGDLIKEISGSSEIILTNIGAEETLIDQFSSINYRSAKYTIQVTNQYTYHVLDLTVLNNGNAAYLLKSNEIFSASSSGTFRVDVVDNQVRLLFQSTENTTDISIALRKTLLPSTGTTNFLGDLETLSGSEDLQNPPSFVLDLSSSTTTT